MPILKIAISVVLTKNKFSVNFLTTFLQKPVQIKDFPDISA